MSQAKPPAKKIGPEEIDEIFNRRDHFGFANFTAGKVAELIVDQREDLDDLNAETVRNHLNAMAAGKVTKDNGRPYDITKYKLGPRTVVYGRADDPQKVVADGGTQFPKLDEIFVVNFKIVSLLAVFGFVAGLYVTDSVLQAGIGLGAGLIIGGLIVPVIYGLAVLGDILSQWASRFVQYYRHMSGGFDLLQWGKVK